MRVIVVGAGLASTRMNRMLTLTGVPAVVRNAVLRAVPDALATRALVRQLRMTRPDDARAGRAGAEPRAGVRGLGCAAWPLRWSSATW